MRLPIRKVLPALAALLVLTACASMGPPLPPSLELPKPPTDLMAHRKGNKVFLSWSVPTVTIDKLRVRYPGPTRICRGFEPVLNECKTGLGEVPPPANFVPRTSSAKKKPSTGEKKNAEPRPSATYTDTMPSRSQINSAGARFVRYAVEALNRKAHSAGLSNQVQVSTAPTLAPPEGFRAEVTRNGVEIEWAPPPPVEKSPGITYRLRVYRRAEHSNASLPAGEQEYVTDLPSGSESAPEGTQGGQEVSGAGKNQTETVSLSKLVDRSFEWEKTYYYHATVVTFVTEVGNTIVQIEGDDTPEVKIFAHDIFPPTVPSGLQAVFSGPGQQAFIDLIWAPVADADLAGYNVYRRAGGGTSEKLNPDPVKMAAYRDSKVSSGKRYAYSVSAVDVRGNESARSEEAAESVP